jgi:hydrogenase maturation protease
MSTRVLCLGNDLIADDAFGPAVARRLRELNIPQLEILETPETGFYLLDYLLDCDSLIVVDTICSGNIAGTIREIGESDIQAAQGCSPHYVGIFETLRIARQLGLGAPDSVTILCVEAGDLTTVGAPMTPAVEMAVPKAVQAIAAHVREKTSASCVRSHPSSLVSRK